MKNGIGKIPATTVSKYQHGGVGDPPPPLQLNLSSAGVLQSTAMTLATVDEGPAGALHKTTPRRNCRSERRM